MKRARKLGDLISILKGNPHADFWVVRRGSASEVGKPTREFNTEHFGITVEKTDTVLPDYLYYWFEYAHGQGHFERMARGSLKLVNIRKADILNIVVEQR